MITGVAKDASGVTIKMAMVDADLSAFNWSLTDFARDGSYFEEESEFAGKAIFSDSFISAS